MTHLVETYGLVLLFLLVALESSGIPLPGETALVAAAVLAARGHFDIAAVIAVAASAAILGDNGGYWIGRLGGRRLLERVPWLARVSERFLPPAERFFERHGAKTVFFGRFIAILRVTAAWLAGISRMPWWRFLLWNALGGIGWAALVSLVAYYFGRAAADAIGHYGLLGGLGAVAVGVLLFLGYRFWSRRMLDAETEPD
jgi:membrane protein DedA with SNARE-associated domain